MQQQETIDFHTRKIWHGMSRLYNAEANKYGLTMSGGFLLLNISKEGTPSTKLGPMMGMEPRSLTRTLKMLHDKGWIRKESDPKDKRIVLIYLTEEGAEKRKIAKEFVIRLNQFIMDGITEEELHTFIKVCNQVESNLERNDILNQD